MALTGYIKNLFVDKEKTIPLFPKTKVKAVSDDNGIGLNVILDELKNEVTPMSKGGTGATDGATGLKNLFADGKTILSSHQYGSTPPSNPSTGQVFFQEATNTIADIGQDVAKAVRAVNLLDNSDFRNPVNQRSAISYNGSCYSVDRWYVWSDDGTGQVAVENGGIALNPFSSSGVSFAQRFPKGYFGDKKYTLAYKDVNGNIFINNNPIRTEFESFDFIEVYVTEWTKIIWTALYEGEYTVETLPPYIPKGYAHELLECQRYYWQNNTERGVEYSTVIGVAISESIMMLINCDFPVSMRTVPSVALTGFRDIMSGEATSLTTSYIAASKDGANSLGILDYALTIGRYYNIWFTASADL